MTGRRLPSFLLLVFITFVQVYTTEVPFLSGRVNDTAGMLSQETIGELEALLKAHEDSTSNQVVVLTIPSLEGEVLEEYSIRVVETWKLGQKRKDNGVLLLVVRDDRKVRIEVGNGLEGDLPDITCGIIVRKEIVPRFRDGNYDAGVRSGITAILAAINGAYTAESADSEGHKSDLWARVIAFSIFIVVVGVFTTIALFTKGSQSWFLYAFLIPFWLAFPLAILGFTAGITMFLTYAIGFIAFKRWASKTTSGRTFQKKWASSGFLASSGSGWSTSGGGGSSGGGFSGGGGSFSGGGASGSW